MKIAILDWTSAVAPSARAALARPAQQSAAEVFTPACARSSATCAPRATPRCVEFTRRIRRRRARRSARSSTAEFATRATALDAEQHRRARARDRQRRALSRSADRAHRCVVETMPGVRLRAHHPADRRASACMCPPASAPLPSTAIMLAVPARIAGCPTRVICTPPRRTAPPIAAVLVAAELCGVDTRVQDGRRAGDRRDGLRHESVRKVDKIFGPGSAWVTAAKLLVADDPDGAAHRPARGSFRSPGHRRRRRRDAEFVAADLLAQAEHDTDAQVILVTTSQRARRRQSSTQVEAQMRALEPRDIAAQVDRARALHSSSTRSRHRASSSATNTRPST